MADGAEKTADGSSSGEGGAKVTSGASPWSGFPGSSSPFGPVATDLSSFKGLVSTPGAPSWGTGPKVGEAFKSGGGGEVGELPAFGSLQCVGLVGCSSSCDGK